MWTGAYPALPCAIACRLDVWCLPTKAAAASAVASIVAWVGLRWSGRGRAAIGQPAARCAGSAKRVETEDSDGGLSGMTDNIVAFVIAVHGFGRQFNVLAVLVCVADYFCVRCDHGFGVHPAWIFSVSLRRFSLSKHVG